METSDRPCMILCWSPSGKRKWFFRNAILPESVWPYDMLPKRTFTQTNAVEVDADKWIDNIAVANYTLIESQIYNGYEYITLLWWKDESSLEEDY